MSESVIGRVQRKIKNYLRINDLKEITPPGLDGHRYQLSVDVGEFNDGIFVPTSSRAVPVTSSGTLQAVWGQTDDQLAESSGTTATGMILELLGETNLDEVFEIKLNTVTAPKIPPTSPKAVPGTIFPIPEHLQAKGKQGKISFLSEDITELRDQINTIALNLFGERILELPQERALIDIYKPVGSAEEFRNRIQSLAGLCIAINKKLIEKILKKDKAGLGPICLLEELLTIYSSENEARKVCSVIKFINELRKGFPTHTDTTDKFLRAHDFFKIRYPIEDFPSSWESILGKYFDAMKHFLEILVRERHKRSECSEKNGAPQKNTSGDITS